MTDEELKARAEGLYKDNQFHEIAEAFAASIDYMSKMNSIFGEYNPFPETYDKMREDVCVCAMALGKRYPDILARIIW